MCTDIYITVNPLCKMYKTWLNLASTCYYFQYGRVWKRTTSIGLTVGTDFKKCPTNWIRKVVCFGKIANTKISSVIYSRNINFCFLLQQKRIFRQSVLRAFGMFKFLSSTTQIFCIKVLSGFSNVQYLDLNICFNDFILNLVGD